MVDLSPIVIVVRIKMLIGQSVACIRTIIGMIVVWIASANLRGQNFDNFLIMLIADLDFSFPYMIYLSIYLSMNNVLPLLRRQCYGQGV